MNFEQYSTSSYAYWERSRQLLSEFEQSRHQLFYAAYELRCAIESFLYDYLDFLHDGVLSKALQKLYLEKHLKNAIYELEPDFEDRIRFNNLAHKAMGLDIVRIPVPDFDTLGTFYGRIGAFMHIQKDAMDVDRWNELETLVKEVQTFMHNLVHPQKSRIKLTSEGVALFDIFKAGSQTHEEIEASIRANVKKYILGAILQM